MHPALRKGPLFYKNTPPPFHFLSTGLSNALDALVGYRETKFALSRRLKQSVLLVGSRLYFRVYRRNANEKTVRWNTGTHVQAFLVQLDLRLRQCVRRLNPPTPSSSLDRSCRLQCRRCKSNGCAATYRLNSPPLGSVLRKTPFTARELNWTDWNNSTHLLQAL